MHNFHKNLTAWFVLSINELEKQFLQIFLGWKHWPMVVFISFIYNSKSLISTCQHFIDSLTCMSVGCTCHSHRHASHVAHSPVHHAASATHPYVNLTVPGLHFTCLRRIQSRRKGMTEWWLHRRTVTNAACHTLIITPRTLPVCTFDSLILILVYRKFLKNYRSTARHVCFAKFSIAFPQSPPSLPPPRAPQVLPTVLIIVTWNRAKGRASAAALADGRCVRNSEAINLSVRGELRDCQRFVKAHTEGK